MKVRSSSHVCASAAPIVCLHRLLCPKRDFQAKRTGVGCRVITRPDSASFQLWKLQGFRGSSSVLLQHRGNQTGHASGHPRLGSSNKLSDGHQTQTSHHFHMAQSIVHLFIFLAHRPHKSRELNGFDLQAIVCQPLT